MIIERTTQQSIFPEASGALIVNACATTYCTEYSPPKRSPLGIYNISLQKVFRGFEMVLNELDVLLKEQPFRDEEKYGKGHHQKIVEIQKSLILSINEHFDGCMNVLQCFYPASIGDKEKKFWKEPPIDTYWQAIKDQFWQPVSDIANFLKHDDGRLTFFVMFNERNNYAIPGYFAETVGKKGWAGPYRKIHQPVISMFDSEAGYDTAFSFFRDLKYLLWGTYFVGHHLADAINQITGGVGLSTQYVPAGPMDTDMIEVSKRIAALPTRYYQDEFKKNIPTVRVVEKDKETILHLAYPGEQILLASEGIQQVLTSFVGDGATKSIKFPYIPGKLDD